MKQTLTLTDNEVAVILRALAICQSDMEEARDEAKNSKVKDYYERKAKEYSRVWGAVYKGGNNDEFFSELDKALAVATDAIEPNKINGGESMRGRPKQADRPAYLRTPSAVYPVGNLSDFPNREEVCRKQTCDRPGEDEEHDPVVYRQVAETGRRTPADLFYILNDKGRRHGVRVYFREVVDLG